jgi:hypothetical protein
MREYDDIKALHDWSMNYNFPSPYSVFLDLIGWSKDELGGPLVRDITSAPLGYLELDYLADALKEIASNGEDAYNYAIALLEEEKANA